MMLKKIMFVFGLVGLLLGCSREAGGEGVEAGFARELGRVAVYHNGRVAAAATMAHDFTATLTGGAHSYKGYDAEGVMAGYIFDFARWRREPVIKVESAELRQVLGIDGSRASFDDFFNAVASGRLELDNGERYGGDLGRFEAVSLLVGGEALRFFPVADREGQVRWLAPTDNMPATVDADRLTFIRSYLGQLNESVHRHDRAACSALLDTLRHYQLEVAGEGVPSAGRLRLERFYLSMTAPRWPPLVLGAVGLALFVMVLWRREPSRGARIAARVAVAAAFALLTFAIALRWVLVGHVPLTNGFETMQALAWLVLLIGLIFNRSVVLQAMTLIGAAAALGVATLGSSGASLTGVIPALDTPLLSVHVLLVMCSYALFLLMALTATAALLSPRTQLDRFAAMINAMLPPALALLGLGIIVGSIWAKLAWGRYWAWDPKEVWALITFLVYALGLLPPMKRPRVLVVFALVSFTAVLVTYFGVNFFFGGLHSYA